IRAAMRIWKYKPRKRSAIIGLEFAGFFRTDETNIEIRPECCRFGYINTSRQVCVDCLSRMTIELTMSQAPIIDPDHTYVHSCSVQNPVAVADREKDVASLLNTVQNFAVNATANTL